jgi:hypothetical protein
LQDLALGALTAVDGGGGCGGAEEDNFEHPGNYTLPPPEAAAVRRQSIEQATPQAELTATQN